MEKKKIIIVDDDDRNIFALNAVLKAKGFACVAATSAREGLEILANTKDIGIALIDMMMPGMDGYQMIAAIRKKPELNNLLLVAVTAQAMVGDREKCLQVGADNYIVKPINVDILFKVIEQHSI
ncbi:MAG TPA: response regulator [Ferruginibacter sp.]|nr:response regulator [Ferruginibacter sp.]